MINVADLIQESTVAGNYFAPDIYAVGDFESGLIENRQGGRLLAIPNSLLRGLHSVLALEVGSAAGIVLYNCGAKWGLNFYQRFNEEVSNHYQKTLAQMTMVELFSYLQECWKAHGWGTIEINCDNYHRGFLVVQTKKSAFAETVKRNERPGCFIEAGLLAAFFSELSGTNLHCVQTTCESLEAKSNTYILGLAPRLKPAEDLVEQGISHSEVMQRLVNN